MPDVEPWDIALNNRQREDVGLFMTYKRFDEMLDRVRLDERERIIELLESGCLDHNIYENLCGSFAEAIALIKGEENG